MAKYISEISILYVEDDLGIRQALSTTLDMWAKKVYLAENGEKGLELFKKHKPDVIISDVKMPKLNGIEMVKEIRKLDENIPIIFTTAHNESGFLHEAIELHVNHYILKPISIKDVKRHLESNAKSILFEKEQKKNQTMLQKIMDNDSDMLAVTDCNQVAFSNSIFKEFFSYDPKIVRNDGKSFCNEFIKANGFLHKGMLKGGEAFTQLIDRTKESDRMVSLYDFKENEPKAFYVNTSKIEDNLYLYHFVDITQIAIEKKLLEKKAYFDKLTKIFSRTKFDDILEYESKRSIRYETQLSLIICDIDHFKKVNDSHGHLVGDEVLKKITKEIKKHIRDTDIFARWGGEEFVLLMPETNLDNAKIVAEQLRSALEKVPHQEVGIVTCSFGLTSFIPTDTLKKFLGRADDSLYQAKQNGRNRVEVIV